jgi:hypothetical protein
MASWAPKVPATTASSRALERKPISHTILVSLRALNERTSSSKTSTVKAAFRAWTRPPRASSLPKATRVTAAPIPPVSARAGRPSVTRLIQSNWIGSSGIGHPKTPAKSMTTSSAAFPVKR